MITMFDAIEAASIPAGAQACAGYAGGHWPDWFAMVQRFPHLAAQERVVSIAINDTEKARILDVEAGDANPGQAGPWVKRMIAEKVWRPGVYADRSRMPAVIRNLNANGLKRDQYVLWIADWTYRPHIPAGFEACQWTDKAGNDDESLCLDSFFPPLTKPAAPDHPEGVANFTGHFDTRTGVWSVAPAPGHVTFAQTDKWASAEVQFNIRSGQWRIASLPWNSPPLGA